MKYYIDGLLTMPDMVKDNYIPSSNLSIKDFIKKELLKISYNLPMIKDIVLKRGSECRNKCAIDPRTTPIPLDKRVEGPL